MADSLAPLGATPEPDHFDSIAALVLAAGSGTRLRPLTNLRPKALCPVGNSALVDHAIEAVGVVTSSVAVNAHHRWQELVEHLDRLDQQIHPSVEERFALGTSGALANLSGWVGDRALLTVNSDMWHQADLGEFVAEWDHQRVAVLTTSSGPFGARSTVVASLTPAAAVARLPVEPSGLWETLWSREVAEARLQTVHTSAVAIDCGTPADYLRANLTFSGGLSVIGGGTRITGLIDRCVVWPDSVVGEAEVLRDSIRAGPLTVCVR